MKIEEAIKIMGQLGWTTPFSLTPDQSNAAQLGIEALNAVKQLREWKVVFDTHKLPGETEE